MTDLLLESTNAEATEPCWVVENGDGRFVGSFCSQLLADFFIDEGGGCYRPREGAYPSLEAPLTTAASRYDQPVRPHGMTAKNEIDRLAIVLYEAWAKAEPRHGVTHFPASYWATFADLARAVIADREAISVEIERLREALAAEDDYWAASRAHASALPRFREATGAVFAAATARRNAARAVAAAKAE